MMVKLGEIITQIRGVSYKPIDVRAAGDPDAVALLRANNIQEDGLNFDDLVWVDKQKVSAEQYLRMCDILICSSSGSKGLVGKAAIVTNDLPCAFGAFCKVVRTKAEYASYLGQFFRSPRYRKEISASAAGANINNIRNEHIDEMLISMPSENERADCVAKLGKIDYLIQRSNNQSHQLDQLVKSRFVEMFGEPFRCPKWKTEQLHMLAESISDGSNIDKQYYKKHDSVLFLRIQNVWFNELRLEDSVYISDVVNKSYFDTSLHKGDLLITKIGRYYTDDSSLGRVSVYLGEDDKANYSNNIMRVRLRDRVNSEFVNALMNLDDYNKYIRNVSVGGTDKRALSKRIIGELPIVVPPEQIQQQYVEFLHQVDKSKLAVKQSLEKLETLKKSLMQQYFG